MEKRLPKGTLGGQAVMEGVMMKGPDGYSVAVRRPDQKIEVKLEKFQSIGDRHPVLKAPFIRVVVNFIEALTVGMKTLTYSSDFYEEEETKMDQMFRNLFKDKAEKVVMGLTITLSVIIAIALFMLAPAAIAEFFEKWIKSRIALSFIEGLIRLFVFSCYVILISMMEDIRRLFMYHGAEHKTINCYEAGEELTPKNVAKYSRYHKRCGTSFLFVVMIISIFVFMFITAKQVWLRLVLRVLLVPVVASLSYEFIRLSGRTDSTILAVLSKPGMWVQRLTTKEPEEEMIQVAIVSVEAVLYGKEYTDAVNEAQGILTTTGKKKEVSSEKKKELLDLEVDKMVLGDNLENEEEDEEDSNQTENAENMDSEGKDDTSDFDKSFFED